MANIENIKVGNTTYPLRDKNTYRSLSTAQATQILADGTYNGEAVTSGEIFTSADGSFKEFGIEHLSPTISWSPVVGPDDEISYSRMVAADGILVAVGSDYRKGVYKSTDKGNTWTKVGTLPIQMSYQYTNCGVAYANGKIFVECQGGTVCYSDVTDLVNWTQTSGINSYGSPDGGVFRVSYINGHYFTWANGGKSTSTDLLTWSSFSGLSGRFCTGNGVITDGKYVSSDGETFTQTTYNKTFNAITYADGKFVGVRISEGKIVTTTDNFTTVTEISTNLPTTSNYASWCDIIYANGMWYLCLDDKVYYSFDLADWTVTATSSEHISTDLQFISPNIIYYTDLHGSSMYGWQGFGSFKGVYAETIVYSLTPLSYNKTSVDTALSDKQDTLTAGTGIDITGNVISATGGGSSVTLPDIAIAGEGITFTTDTPVTGENFTKVGTPTITDKVVTSLDSSNYLVATGDGASFNVGNNSWEIKAKVSFDNTNDQAIFAAPNDMNNLVIGINGNKNFYLLATSNGYTWINWTTHTGSHTVQANTIYWIKAGYDGTNYYLKYSLDGETYIDDAFYTAGDKMRTAPLYIHAGWSQTFSSHLYLEEVSASIDGVVVWTPYVTSGTGKEIVSADADAISGYSFPATNHYTTETVTASGDTFTAPANGYYVARGTATSGGQYLELIGVLDSLVQSSTNLDLAVTLPVLKGQTVTLYYNTDTPTLKFVYAEGAS